MRAFLAANRHEFPTESYDTAEDSAQHRRWDRVLFDAGLSVITWPEKYGGRDASLLQWVVFEEEYFRRRCPGASQRQLSTLYRNCSEAIGDGRRFLEPL